MKQIVRKPISSRSVIQGRKSGKVNHAKSVPTVPGAKVDRPLPKPQATRCAGWASRKAMEGGVLLAKMVVSLAGGGQRLPVFVEK